MPVSIWRAEGSCSFYISGGKKRGVWFFSFAHSDRTSQLNAVGEGHLYKSLQT